MKITPDLKTSSPDPQARRCLRFARMTNQFAASANAEGISVRPFRGSEPHFFPLLSADEQIRVLHTFGTYVEVAQETLAHNESLTKRNQFLWRMIKRLGLHPLGDLFSTITDDDIVEIYDMPSNVQVFRSLKLFSLCSYTLDEMLCRPWWDLYERDEEITTGIMATVQKVLDQKTPGTLHYNLPLHHLKERDSERRLLCRCHSVFVSPLLNQDKETKAVINVVRGEILEEGGPVR